MDSDKKRIVLTVTLTLFFSIALKVTKALENTDFMIAYMIVFLFVNLHLSE